MDQILESGGAAFSSNKKEPEQKDKPKRCSPKLSRTLGFKGTKNPGVPSQPGSPSWIPKSTQLRGNQGRPWRSKQNCGS